MKSLDFFRLLDIGLLDWARIGVDKGHHTNIGFTIYAYKPGKRVNHKMTRGKAIRRRLKNTMSIKLGLTLDVPLYMPIMISETLMMDEQFQGGLMRELRLDESGRTKISFRNGYSDSKLKPVHRKLFRVLMKAFLASNLNAYVNCNDPAYIEITLTIDRRTFKVPSKLLIDLMPSIREAMNK